MSKTVAYNTDCMEYMATLPDKAFHLAIVDPPYGIGANKRRGNTGKNSHIKQKEYHEGDWDSEIPNKYYFDELFRVSRNQIVWGGNYMLSHLYNTPCFIVWNKDNGSNLYADCEIAWTSFKTAVRMFTWKWHGFLQQNMKNKEMRIHPTQKPVALYEWLLLNYAKEGDKILDTHLGSGSSRIAAHKLGFEFVGCELDKDYFEAQEKRFKIETMQQSLF